jgi:hypothetical protein
MISNTEIKRLHDERNARSKGKPHGWIGVDLDATVALYDGWKGKEHIGEPIPFMIERIKEKMDQGYEIRIFTARASQEDQIPFVEAWCEKHIGKKLVVTCCKDFACEEIWDDRAKQVVPNSGRFLEEAIL